MAGGAQWRSVAEPRPTVFKMTNGAQWRLVAPLVLGRDMVEGVAHELGASQQCRDLHLLLELIRGAAEPEGDLAVLLEVSRRGLSNKEENKEGDDAEL